MAAGLATMDFFQKNKVFENAASLAPYWEERLHSTLKGLPNIVDVRNYGLMGGVEFAPYSAQAPSKRADDVFRRAYAKGVFLRYTGNTVATAPPLIAEKEHVDKIVDTIAEAVEESAQQLK